MFYKISDDGISVLSSTLQIYLIKASNIVMVGHMSWSASSLPYIIRLLNLWWYPCSCDIVCDSVTAVTSCLHGSPRQSIFPAISLSCIPRLLLRVDVPSSPISNVTLSLYVLSLSLDDITDTGAEQLPIAIEANDTMSVLL